MVYICTGISNTGKKFHLMFPASSMNGSHNISDVLFVTTDHSQPVSFIVYCSTLKTTIYSTARKGELTRIVLSRLQKPLRLQSGVQLQTRQKGKRIIVYAIMKDGASTAAYLGLPYFETATKTYDYYGVSSSRSSLKSLRSRGYMAVVILKDNTVLSMTSTVILEGNVPGTPTRKMPGVRHRSTPCFTGQTYIVTSTEDLTGSKISANNPITFITGVQCGYHPSKELACDYLSEQLPPAETFGSRFFLAPLRLHQQAGCKLVATVNNTSAILLCVNRSGQIVQWDSFKLNEGQFRQFIINSDHYCSIEANLPILVVQIFLGHSFNAIGKRVSDSFMTMVPPLGQYRNEYTFLFTESSSVDNSSNPADFERQLSLCVPVNCFNSSKILFDDRLLPDDVIYVTVKCKNGNVCAYCTQYEVPADQSHGVHTLKHTDWKCRIGVIVSSNGRENSYAYPAGMHLNSIAGNNEIHRV